MIGNMKGKKTGRVTGNMVGSMTGLIAREIKGKLTLQILTRMRGKDRKCDRIGDKKYDWNDDRGVTEKVN